MRPWTHVLLAFVSVIILIASVHIPRTLRSREELAAVPLGFPISFAVQDLSSLDPPDFPRRYAFMSPWERPVRLLPGRMALSFLCILGVLEMAARGVLSWRARSHDDRGEPA